MRRKKREGLWTGLAVCVSLVLLLGFIVYLGAGPSGFLRGALIASPVGLSLLYAFASTDNEEPSDVPIAS